MSNLTNYLNLSEEQTELIKYLHSQISETSKQRNSDVSKLAIWIQAKEEDSADMQDVIDYEIKRCKASISSLQRRFDYLVEQLKWAQLTYEYITSPL